MILGIDIGGANTKIASSDGSLVELHYIPLWKNTTLAGTLADVSNRLAPSRVRVVTTGELADCFKSKRDGVSQIMAIVGSAFTCPIEYLGSDCRLSETPEDILTLAAANWTASAMFVGQMHSDCVFVDVGSTTSDIIPIVNGRPAANTSDFMRLQNNELVYAGTLRTNLACLARTVQIYGSEDGQACQPCQRTCGTSSELFATTADVYLLTGDITAEQYTCETADGEGKGIDDAKRRIARVVCSDLEEIDDMQVMDIARQIKERQIDELASAMGSVCTRVGVNTIVGTGIGEFLIAQAAKRINAEYISISSIFGKTISTVFPAYAVANISGAGPTP